MLTATGYSYMATRQKCCPTTTQCGYQYTCCLAKYPTESWLALYWLFHVSILCINLKKLFGLLFCLQVWPDGSRELSNHLSRHASGTTTCSMYYYLTFHKQIPLGLSSFLKFWDRFFLLTNLCTYLVWLFFHWTFFWINFLFNIYKFRYLCMQLLVLYLYIYLLFKFKRYSHLCG